MRAHGTRPERPGSPLTREAREATRADIAYGMAAGAANVVGLALLYRALSQHAAGVVAPITAVVASIVPVTWALVRGEHPPVVVLLGSATAIVAGALVARDPHRT